MFFLAGVAINLAVASLEAIHECTLVAIWHFWRHDVLERLNHELQRLFHESYSCFGLTVYVTDDMIMLLPADLQPIEVKQHAGEMVLVPIGCPHQVRSHYMLFVLCCQIHICLFINRFATSSRT